MDLGYNASMRHHNLLISALLAVLLLVVPGCGSDSNALIQYASPLPGSTAVPTDVVVEIQLHHDAELDENLLSRKNSRVIVLYDVTGGGKFTVGGTISAGIASFAYRPTAALRAGRTFALEMKRSAVLGSGFDETDGVMWPDEPITWPYRLTFTTASAPRVRGAYLQESDGEQRVVVYFSQAMDMVASSGSVSVLDGVTRAPVKLGRPVWVSDTEVEVRPERPLAPASLYVLKVDTTATAADNTRFDGNANGKPGENTDAFCAQFTGSQEVIFSRLGIRSPSRCP